MPERSGFRFRDFIVFRVMVRRAARELLLSAQGQTPKQLSHYTDAAGALSIIQTGTLWATDALFMNDASELRLASEIFETKLHRWLGQNVHLKASRIAFAEGFWDGFRGEGDLDEHPLYVACFCEDDDLLSQWRAYGKSGVGYSLQFDATELDEWAGDDVELLSVIYDQKRQEALARALVLSGVNLAKNQRPKERGQRRHTFLSAGQITGEMARTFAYRVKHKSFAEEKEWRLVYQGPPAGSPFGDIDPKTRAFRAAQRGIAPYVTVDFDPARAGDEEDDEGLDRPSELPLRSVRTGPTAHPELANRAVRYLLDDEGYTARVHQSTIPLRA